MNKNDLKKIIAISAVTAAATAAAVIVISRCRRAREEKSENEFMLHGKNAYITGGGLSALAAALYLARDCKMEPKHIHIFSDCRYAAGSEEGGYICRRGKIIDDGSMNLFDLLSGVHSVDIPDLTVCDEILNIYSANPVMRPITLIDGDKNVIDVSDIRLDREEKKALISLLRQSKEQLLDTPLCEALPQSFFASHFWKLLSAAYGFGRLRVRERDNSCGRHAFGHAPR